MDAVYEGDVGLQSVLLLFDEGGHLAVGQQHEVLDEHIRIDALLDVHVYGAALVVEFEAYLVAIKVDTALLEAALAQFIGDTLHLAQFVDEVALTGIEHCLGVLVGKAAVGMDDGTAEPAVGHL